MRLLFDVLDLSSQRLCGQDCLTRGTHHKSGDFFAPLNLLSVGMHGDAIAVVVFVFLMIMNEFSASGLPDEALVRGR